MTSTSLSSPPLAPVSLTLNRFVGLDVSKHSVMVAAVSSTQQIVIQPKKVEILRFELWARQHLLSTDLVVLEATTNAWYFYDLLKPLVASVTISNPNDNKIITQSKVKTDARDALHLAKLLAANFITPVWVPPQPVRDLRALINHHERLVRQRTRSFNRLHAILQTHNLFPPLGNPFAEKNRSWWEGLNLSTSQKLLVKQEMQVLSSIEPLITEVENEITQLSNRPNWASDCGFLIALPGIQVMTAMTILAAIGDIRRFATSKRLVGYSGLGASIYSSGDVCNTGSITKEGRKELRTALVEAARNAVAQEGHWQDEFKRLSSRLGKNKAIVAIARKMLVVIWHVLTKGEAEHQADQVKVARKMLNWAYKLRRSGRQGMRGKEFARRQLEKLGLEPSFGEFNYNGKPFSLAPPAVPTTQG